MLGGLTLNMTLAAALLETTSQNSLLDTLCTVCVCVYVYVRVCVHAHVCEHCVREVCVHV